MAPITNVEEQEGNGEDDEGLAIHMLLVPSHELLVGLGNLFGPTLVLTLFVVGTIVHAAMEAPVVVPGAT